MKKVLMLASVASMIDQFNMPNIKLLQSLGYSVDVACNFQEGSTCSDEKIIELKEKLKRIKIYCYQIDFARDITNIRENIKALWQVEQLMKMNEYAFIHCHSPIGGVVGRIAGKAAGTKVIYTAHGFHFFKGSPKKNWFIYYPLEWIFAHWTDVLITINKEDYSLARKKMKAKTVVYMPGIGIDLEKFTTVNSEKRKKRKELGISEKSIILLSVGELNENKNHETVIRAISGMDVYYLIAGVGNKAEQLRGVAMEVGMSERVKFLGYRTDVNELLNITHAFIFPSYREGLSVSLMEAMVVGLPCVVSKIRGNTDLIDSNGGFLFNPKSIDECKEAITSVLQCDQLKIREYNIKKILDFGSNRVISLMKKVYL